MRGEEVLPVAGDRGVGGSRLAGGDEGPPQRHRFLERADVAARKRPIGRNGKIDHLSNLAHGFGRVAQGQESRERQEQDAAPPSRADELGPERQATQRLGGRPGSVMADEPAAASFQFALADGIVWSRHPCRRWGQISTRGLRIRTRPVVHKISRTPHRGGRQDRRRRRAIDQRRDCPRFHPARRFDTVHCAGLRSASASASRTYAVGGRARRGRAIGRRWMSRAKAISICCGPRRAVCRWLEEFSLSCLHAGHLRRK